MFPFMRDVQERPLDDGGLYRRFTDARNSSYVITRVFDLLIFYTETRRDEVASIRCNFESNEYLVSIRFLEDSDVKLILLSLIGKKKKKTDSYPFISNQLLKNYFEKFTR